MTNEYIAVAYDEINKKKAARLRDCANFLKFVRDGSHMRLVSASFCRVRLCSICQWRRSMKLFGQMRKIMGKIGNKYRYIFLTLTMKNMPGPDLSAALDQILLGFNALSKYKEFRAAVKGWYRGLEVTHNLTTDMYHPHLHVLLAVNPSYFTSRDYISQQRFRELWQRALGVNYAPVVHVEKVKGNTCKAVAECAKYAAKAADFLNFDDWDLTVDTVRLLDGVLANRRLVAFGGELRKVHKELNLDDIDNGDLLDIGEDESGLDEEENPNELVFVWHTGYCNYVQDV